MGREYNGNIDRYLENVGTIKEIHYHGIDANPTNSILNKIEKKVIQNSRRANIDIVGRDKEIKEISEQLTKDNNVLVTGMGGIGKTAIIEKINDIYVDNRGEGGLFDHVLYFEYANIKEKLFEVFAISGTDDKESEMWNNIKFFCSEKRCLFVIDNVDVTMDDREYILKLARIPECKVLISSREKEIKGYSRYSITSMKEKEYIVLFKQIYNEKIKLAETELSLLKCILETRANKHTLTIKLLAAVARDNGYTIESLEKELERRKFKIEYLEQDDEKVVLQQLKELFEMTKLKEEEKKILDIFTFFPYLGLSRETCITWMKKDVGIEHTSNLQQNKVFKDLVNRHWLEVEEGNTIKYRMHPIIKEVVKEERDIIIGKYKNVVKACIETMNIEEKYKYKENYGEFAYSLLKSYSEEAKDSEYAKLCEIETEVYCRYTINLDKALAYANESLKVRVGLYGEEHSDTARSYNDLGICYEEKGDYEKGLVYKEKALEIRRSIYGEEHSDTATSYNNVGYSYGKKGDLKKGLVYKEKALEIRRKIYGEEHSDTATSYDNVGYSYQKKGEIEKGLEYQEKALEIRRKIYGEEHSDTARSYNNVGYSYFEKGEIKKGLAYKEKALEIRRKIYGEEHSDTATSYNNVGSCYEEKGELEKGQAYQEKALEIRRRIYGEEHSDTATSYNNVGLLYYENGNHKKAKEYLLKSYCYYERNKSIYNDKYKDSKKMIKIFYNRSGRRLKFERWVEKELEKIKEREKE